jgi:hypothetical protein
VRLVYTQISPGHIWITLYMRKNKTRMKIADPVAPWKICSSSSCLLYRLGADPTENTVPNSYSLVVCVSVAAETSCHVLFTGRCVAAYGFPC